VEKTFWLFPSLLDSAFTKFNETARRRLDEEKSKHKTPNVLA